MSTTYHRSVIRNFASIVCSSRWQDVPIVMLTICCDAAGKEADKKTPAIVVAGFSSAAAVWDEFDLRWSAVLEKHQLPHFHAGDFALSKPPFHVLRGDEPKRRALVADLLAVIQECGLRRFGGFIRKKDIPKGKMKDGFSSDTTVDGYVLCARSVADDFLAFARGDGATDNLTYIFEKGDSEDLLTRHFREQGFPEPIFKWSKVHVTRKGIKHSPFLGLQAAGWLAWEYYIDFCRLIGLDHHRATDEGRVPFRAFEVMPGHPKIVYLGYDHYVDIFRQVENSTRESFRVGPRRR